MKKREKIVVLIPCHNEEEGIEKVIKGFQKKLIKSEGYDLEIIVIDNNSTDKTMQIAKKLGVKVISEERKGKGHAVRTGFNNLPDCEYVVIIDGDHTYKGAEVLSLIEPIKKNQADFVVGSRLEGNIKEKALRKSYIYSNKLNTTLVRILYRSKTTDVYSGYIAFKREVLEKLKPHLISKGFEIELEINIKMTKLGYRVLSVPITYDVRKGTSKMNGLKILPVISKTFIRHINWKAN